MITIAILDDNIEEATTTKKILLPYLEDHHMEYDRIDIFVKGKDLLQSTKTYDILFLDIEVGDENGIDIAKQLRNTQPDIIIMVITSYMKYSIEGYKVHAARYLLKPVAPSLLYSELDEVLADRLHRQSILIRDAREERLLRIHDIYYYESYGRKTQFHMRVQTHMSKENVSYWAMKLGNDFIECYKGIYANIRYIEHVGKETLQLDNKQTLLLARRRVDIVRNAWIAYQEKCI